jgi:REP element-mobilizing transposase RayT
LTEKNKIPILNHIRDNCKKQDIYLDFINGYRDHVHCIISLNQEQKISNVIRLIKGESSYWINKVGLTENKFEWSDEYFAVSISESHVKQVRNYIKNQEKHHDNTTWLHEYNEFIKMYRFQR